MFKEIVGFGRYRSQATSMHYQNTPPVDTLFLGFDMLYCISMVLQTCFYKVCQKHLRMDRVRLCRDEFTKRTYVSKRRFTDTLNAYLHTLIHLRRHKNKMFLIVQIRSVATFHYVRTIVETILQKQLITCLLTQRRFT